MTIFVSVLTPSKGEKSKQTIKQTKKALVAITQSRVPQVKLTVNNELDLNNTK